MNSIRSLKVVLVLISSLSIIYFLVIIRSGFAQSTMDDSYMFLRYAKHWIAGSGFSWNDIDGPSYGITSVMYLFIITILEGLTDFPDATILAGTSLAFGVLACSTMVVLGFLASKYSSGEKSWLPLLIIPGLLLMPSFQYHSLSGMETTLSIFSNTLLACSLVIWAYNRSRLYFITCILFSYLTFLVRPDNGVYAILLPALFFVAIDRAQWRLSLVYFFAFAIILILDAEYKEILFGSFIPFPFFAKSSNFLRGYLGTYKWNPISELLLFLGVILPFLIMIILMATKKVYGQIIALGIPILITFLYFSKVTQVMGYNARYYYPSTPFIVLAAFFSFPHYSDKAFQPKLSHRFPLKRIALTSLILILACSPSLHSKATLWWQENGMARPQVYVSITEYKTEKNINLPELSWSQSVIEIISLLKRLPSNTKLAASEYGVIGSALPEIAIIDMIGLHDEYIAHHGFSSDYVLFRAPDIIWFPEPDYSYEIASILDNREFANKYDYYPTAYSYGLAVRKEFSSNPEIRYILDDEFARVYTGLRMKDYRATKTTQSDYND